MFFYHNAGRIKNVFEKYFDSAFQNEKSRTVRSWHIQQTAGTALSCFSLVQPSLHPIIMVREVRGAPG
jgi:hypothetical protein